MSLAELLPAIRALAMNERQELLKILREQPDINDEIPESVRNLIRPGMVVDMWKPELDSKDFEIAMQFHRDKDKVRDQ